MTTENGKSILMERECGAAEAFLNTLRDELRTIAPSVREAHVQHQDYFGEQRWGAHVSMDDSVSEDYRDRSVFSFGTTLEKALQKLRADVQEWQQQMDARTQCCVEGCSSEAAATTGEGPMCREHAVAWLEGEKALSEMNESADMG